MIIMVRLEEIISLNKLADILNRRKKSGEYPFILFLGISTSLRSSNSNMTEVIEKFLYDKSVHRAEIKNMDDYEKFEKFYELMRDETHQSRFDWFSAIFGNALPSSGYLALTSLLTNVHL